MSRTTYIYALTDPRDDSCQYVGKSNHPKRRRKQHVREALAKGKTTRKCRCALMAMKYHQADDDEDYEDFWQPPSNAELFDLLEGP